MRLHEKASTWLQKVGSEAFVKQFSSFLKVKTRHLMRILKASIGHYTVFVWGTLCLSAHSCATVELRERLSRVIASQQQLGDSQQESTGELEPRVNEVQSSGTPELDVEGVSD